MQKGAIHRKKLQFNMQKGTIDRKRYYANKNITFAILLYHICTIFLINMGLIHMC